MDFAIISPKLGIDESTPRILLSDAFVTDKSRNVHEKYGEYRKVRGRLAQLVDALGEQIITPTNVYAIVSVVSGTKIITVTGDVTAVISDGDTIRINGSSESTNETTFTVAGTPVYSSPNSTIIVSEAITTMGATGNVFAGATPIIKYHNHKLQQTGVEYLLVATAYHIFLWTYTSKFLTVKFTCATPASVERWSICSHLNDVYATNFSDLVQWWNVSSSPSGSFDDLGSATGIDYDGSFKLTKAKYITSYQGYLRLGYTEENAVEYPTRDRWASLNTKGATIDFNQNGSGDAGCKDFNDTTGFITGYGKHGNDLIVAKQDQMNRGWITTEDTVFEWIDERVKVGCMSPDTLVNDKSGRLYWLASDFTIRELMTPEQISSPADKTLKNINTTGAEFAQAAYIDEYDEIWFALPIGSSETNDTIVALDVNTRKQYIHNFPIRAFGDYSQQETYTYDTLPYSTYAEWGAAWKVYNTNVNEVGFPLDLASDYSGKTYNLHSSDTDAGDSYDGIIVISTSMDAQKGNLNLYKRINNGMEFYFNRESSGTVTVAVKRDGEKSWQSQGSIEITNTDEGELAIKHLPMDIRARSFEIKLTCASYFEYVGSILTEIELDDTR
jgi:hypothetical protein